MVRSRGHPRLTPLSLNAAGVIGPRTNDESQGPDQSACDNDKADEQLAQQPQAQTKTHPQDEPEAEEPETDAQADPQADPQARGEALDLETGDGPSVSAPDGEKDEPHQRAARDGASQGGGPDVGQ